MYDRIAISRQRVAGYLPAWLQRSYALCHLSLAWAARGAKAASLDFGRLGALERRCAVNMKKQVHRRPARAVLFVAVSALIS